MRRVAMVCRICAADVPDEQVVDFQNGLAHLLDTGAAHHELAVHPLRRAVSTGRVYQPAEPPPPPRHQPAGFADLQALAAAVAGWVIWADVSKWQGRPFDASYPWDFAVYRLTLSTTTIDQFGAANAAYCHANAGPGKQLAAHGGYHVWYPGNEAGQAAAFFAQAVVDDYFVAMIDAERWGGAISGNHSPQLNQLAELFAARVGRDRVLPYGNQADLDELWPNRPSWLQPPMKARYAAVPPAAPFFGWQYSDGSAQWPVAAGWPRSSAPFGPCDHNAFKGTTADLLARFGITGGGITMDDAQLTALINTAAHASATLVAQNQQGTNLRVVQVLADCVTLMGQTTTILQDVEALPGKLQQVLTQAGGGGTVDVHAVAAQVAPLLRLAPVASVTESAQRLAGNALSLMQEITDQAKATAAAAAELQQPAPATAGGPE